MCCCCIVTVDQSEVAVVEVFGRFSHAATAGLHCIVPCTQQVVGTLSLRLQEHNVQIETTKTRDNSSISVELKVQYQLLLEAVEKVFYSPEKRVEDKIEACVSNSVRGQVAEIDLDQVLLMPSEISEKVKEQIIKPIEEFGFDVVNVSIINLDVVSEVPERV